MKTTLHQLLRDRRDEIVRRFVAKVKRAGSAPPGVPSSQLVDHIPSFLESVEQRLLAAEVGATAASSSEQVKAAAQEHGEHTWKLGYDLAGLVREYDHLREAILELASEADVAWTVRDFEVLGRCLSDGVAEAVKEYVRFRDRERDEQRDHLEFLARAGELLASSLDYRFTLTRLMGLLVPRLADWCAVHLDGQSVDDMPLTHVDSSKVEMVREVYRRGEFPGSSPHGYSAVMGSGETDHARSWLIVPLRAHEHTFGALTLVYSDSDRKYGDSDVVLANDLARRAAFAIDNARLFQLSQRERSKSEAASRAKDEFVAMVSHELRTPLNAILGWIRLIRGGGLDAAKSSHALDVIQRNAEAQDRLVSDLLDISRTMTGKVRLHPAQVDLANVVDLTLEDLRLAFEVKRIDVLVDLDRRRATLRGDGDRLQQIVWNLLSNAIKFTPKGGQIRVQLTRVESDLELVVSDTGIGMDSEVLPHVFEAFFQSESSSTRRYGGLGVGLSISKHLVDLHGGRIEAKSEGKGRGATFVVRLPVSPLVSTTVGVAQVAATRASEINPPPAAVLQGIRVLVVDDDADACELVGIMLESCGAEVQLANSATIALAALSTNTPDILISDIGMPEQDGYSLIRTLRTSSVPAHNELPAIALTAFTQSEDRARALVAGFNLHLSKPVEASVLVNAVASLAGRTIADRREP